MPISDTDQHIPFLNIVADGVTSIDTFNTWRKKTNGIIKVINDGLITRYIADRAITPSKLSQGGPYWDPNGNFHTNGNNTRLGYAKTGNINAYIGIDRSGDGVSSLFFQTASANGGAGSGANTASIVRQSGLAGMLNITNIGGPTNLKVDTGSTIGFEVGTYAAAFFNKDGLAVTDEIKSRNVKVQNAPTPYYRLTSNVSGALSWNLESSSSRFYIRTGTTDITTTREVAANNFTRTGNVVMVNAPGHGYPTGSIATISGTINSAFHGTYSITNVDANSFSYMTTASGALAGSSSDKANISVVITPITPLQILNNASVIVGGRTTSTARSGDEFTVLGDSYLSGSLTVTGTDTAIGHSIGASTASLSIGINRTENGSSAVKFYSSKTDNALETASITRDTTNLIINNTGSAATLYRQGVGGSHKFQISNGTDQVDRFVIDKDGNATISGTLTVSGGLKDTAFIGDAVATKIVNAEGDHAQGQTYFKVGTANVTKDYFLIVAGNRADGASDRTGILIRSHGGSWTPASNTDNYNTDGLFIEKGSGLGGHATIYNSSATDAIANFEIRNLGAGDIKFVTTSTDGAKARLEIKGNTGAATFSNEVTSTRFKGPLTGDVIGDVTGDVKGNVTGNVKGNATGTLLTAENGTNRIKIDSNQIRVDGNLDINKTGVSGTSATTKQDTIIYDGANSTIVKFVGSTKEVEFSGDAIMAASKKLQIKPADNTARARLQIGDWYIGQSHKSDGTKDLYIATADTSTISSPRLLINSATGKITGTISNADVAASLSSVLPISNGGTGATTAAAALTALGAAPLNSPTFTGTVKTVEPSNTSNDTTVATTAFVRAVASGAVGANAPTLTGGGASGTWGINITGNAATATSATTATTATTCTGNAGSVTNGVYDNTDQTISGTKTFSKVVYLSDNGIMFNSDSGRDTGLTWASDGVFNVRCNNTTVGTFRSTGWNGNVIGNVTGTVTGSLNGNATTATTCTGEAGSVKNGVYTTGNQSIDGIKTFGNVIRLSDSGLMFNSDGAQDTGLTWASDGVFNVRCNNVTVGQFNSTGWTGNAATANTAGHATTAGHSLTTGAISTTGLTTNGNQINPGSSGELALTYQNSNGTTNYFYDTTIFDGKKNIVTRFDGQYKTQYNTGNIVINNGGPTLYLQDTDHLSGMIRIDQNKFYILRGNNTNSTTWDTSRPLTIDLSNNSTTFGGDISTRDNINANNVNANRFNNIFAIKSGNLNMRSTYDNRASISWSRVKVGNNYEYTVNYNVAGKQAFVEAMTLLEPGHIFPWFIPSRLYPGAYKIISNDIGSKTLKFTVPHDGLPTGWAQASIYTDVLSGTNILAPGILKDQWNRFVITHSNTVGDGIESDGFLRNAVDGMLCYINLKSGHTLPGTSLDRLRISSHYGHFESNNYYTGLLPSSNRQLDYMGGATRRNRNNPEWFGNIAYTAANINDIFAYNSQVIPIAIGTGTRYAHFELEYLDW